MQGKRTAWALMALLPIATSACSPADGTGPDMDEVTLLMSVVPQGGSVNVSADAVVVVTFDHAIAQGMEQYGRLHEGTVQGPEVAGAWARSEDGTTLTFTPAAALKPSTTYVIHLGGGMMDQGGHGIDLDRHGHGLGGEWATGSMMGGTSGMGGTGGGHMESHAGSGWQHSENGTWGMIFSFTTAAG